MLRVVDPSMAQLRGVGVRVPQVTGVQAAVRSQGNILYQLLPVPETPGVIPHDSVVVS